MPVCRFTDFFRPVGLSKLPKAQSISGGKGSKGGDPALDAHFIMHSSRNAVRVVVVHGQRYANSFLHVTRATKTRTTMSLPPMW
jgi:hypothetical protein